WSRGNRAWEGLCTIAIESRRLDYSVTTYPDCWPRSELPVRRQFTRRPFELSRKRQARARAVGIAERVNQRTKGVRWDDPTTQTNDGGVATAQPLPCYS